MRPWKAFAAVSVLAAVALLGIGAPGADAGDTLVVKRFLLGHLDPNTGAFIALGGRGAEEVRRDSVILLVFTAPVDPESVGARTIRIGVPSTPGLIVPAKGSFHMQTVSAFDPVSSTFLQKRAYRNRVLFDPLARWDGFLSLQDRQPFDGDTTYSVTVPGVDQGALKTLKSTKGTPVARTFTTTFRTSDEEFTDLFCPGMDDD